MTKLFSGKLSKQRTASMQLSVEAIVILVMAMAVLGIGLGLIRGVLGSGKDKLLGSIEKMDLDEEATSERLITNTQGIKLKNSKDNVVAIGFYNRNNDKCVSTGATFELDCGENLEVNPSTPVNPGNPANPVASTDKLEVSAVTVPIAQGTAGKLGAIIKPTADLGTYACTLKVMCDTATGATSEAATTVFIEIIS